MPLKLSRRGVRALSGIAELDDESLEILWIIKERNEEPRGITTLGHVVAETGRGREAIRDVKHLANTGFIDLFEY